MKKVSLLLMTILLSACGDDGEVGDVSLGLLTTKDIKVDVLIDPLVTG